MALSIGGGGFNSIFDYKDGLLYEKQLPNNISAYMLVYIRDSDRKNLMGEMTIDEIPPYLKVKFNEEK